uniref:Peptide-methionine (R)-S-oxide reductase n=1 Tax=Minutocellus polymorphus TaxID=265543 RepID=A0A7S0AM35_9STRA|mmetsp:Transcript_17077/g.28438  ORF Transcript_17077/g.28438 Transcript_17077/m.28438 type:complete len:215 (+) Transcript_17077:54-698(+)
MRLTVPLLLSAIAAAGAFSATPETSRRDALQSMGLLGIAAATTAVGPAAANADDAFTVGGKMKLGDESIMYQKDHGSSAVPVQENLRYGVSRKLADRISNYNRRFAELGGYFQETSFEDVVRAANGPVTFYDSNTGKALFQAPIGRSADEFIDESKVHGWPSFRDNEVVWDNVRVLKNSGETVSVDGTHLGHNLPDRRGNRYCINLVSVAGSPA